MWWKDMKMRMCIVIGIIILLVIIIVPIVVTYAILHTIACRSAHHVSGNTSHTNDSSTKTNGHVTWKPGLHKCVKIGVFRCSSRQSALCTQCVFLAIGFL